MKVPLKPGWEAKVSTIKLNVYPLSKEVYPVGNEAQQLVDKNFDEMYCLSRYKFINEHIPFSFPIFIVWKANTEGKKKERVMVDIQKLNEIVLSNSYPLSLQLEITANVQGCIILAALDAASFFY